MMPDEDFEYNTQPHSTQAEEGVIGAALINPECVKTLPLSPDDFYIVRNKWVWDSIQTISNAKKELDFLTLVDELEKRGQLEEIGGRAYLMGVINACPSSLHAEAYSDTITEMSMRRNIIAEANRLAQAGYNKKIDPGTIVAEVISNLATRTNTRHGATHIKQAVSEFYDTIDKRYKNPIPAGKVSGMSTGFLDYDDATDGLHLGEETVLSAKPGLGKSLFAMQLASNLADNDAGAVYELEMGISNLIGRQISGMARVTTRAMARGHINDLDWPNIVKAIEEMSLKPIYISTDTQWTILKLRADLARLKETANIKWFVLDYLRLLKDRYGANDTERTEWLSSQLHDICKDLNLAGLVIQSMNKAGMKEGGNDMTGLAGGAGVGLRVGLVLRVPM